jgi:signal transduction histidine kinase
MWSRLSLTSKGLLLLAVPLLFEIAFVALLANLQQEAEHEAQKAVQARDISNKLSRVTTDLYTFYSNITNYARSTRSGGVLGSDLNLDSLNIASTKYLNDFTKLAHQYEELEKLTRDKAELNSLMKRSAASALQARAIVAAVVRDLKAGEIQKVIASREATASHLGEMLKAVFSDGITFAVKQEAYLAEDSYEKQAAIRANIIKLSYFALAANAVFGILLALFFMHTIIARLAILSDNAVKLAANENLHPPLPGADEIARVDGAFHHMAETIAENNRMKQDLVATLTHDLRAPLTIVQGALEMMSQGMLGSLNERGNRLTKLADRNCFQMMSLINDILDSHKIQADMMVLEFEAVPVAELYESIRLSVADWVTEHGITLKVHDSSLVVWGDRERLNRVIFNLVANAVKYSQAGDTIEINAGVLDGYVELTVADQGPGIPQEMLNAIFNRFQQVSNDARARQGSGLGLAICREIVALHKGQIWATSEPGRGSIFHFTLQPA